MPYCEALKRLPAKTYLKTREIAYSLASPEFVEPGRVFGLAPNAHACLSSRRFRTG